MRNKLSFLTLAVGLLGLCLSATVRAGENLCTNPIFELDADGNVNQNPRAFSDVLNWEQWGDAALATATDHPTATLQAETGTASIWTALTSETMKAGTVYYLQVDIKSLSGAGATAILVYEDSSWANDQTLTVDISESGWNEYTHILDTAALPVFVGSTVSFGIRSGSGLAAVTNIYFGEGPRETAYLSLAHDPSPEHEVADVAITGATLSWMPGVSADKHDVYFGADFGDVNSANASDLTGIYRGRYDVNSYTPPEVLDLGTTYYWRVDEVNAPPESTVFEGDVWSFTSEPFAYPVENITATASSSLEVDTGPSNTINGSGLDADDLHSREETDMWISGNEPNGAWIEFELGKIYKLHEMLVWNSNQMTEFIVGYGYKDVIIEYSVDGNDYTTLGATHEFLRAPGTPGYAHNTTIDFGGAAAKYIRLTANSNWGDLDLPHYSLSEVRFFYIPLRAREPQPESEATDVDIDLVLSFRAGREAAEHNVYIGTDEQAVIDSNVPVSIVTEAQDGPKSLDLNETYYWKVNEVNMAETPAMLQGDIWNFTTADSLVVEDFESYHDDIEAGEEGSNQVYLTWIDGYENPLVNGATIGYTVAYQPSMETDTVHDGDQSVPFSYDNSTADYSEATANIANLAIGGNWTLHGIKSLSLWFYGDPNNTPEQMYVKLDDVTVLYDGDAGNITNSSWHPWDINLADFDGVDLSNVIKLSIGFERIGLFGGFGTLLFDNIRLYGPAPVQGENLLLNPSFEEDEAILDDPEWAQWTTWNPAEGAGSSATIVDTESIDGARSLRVDAIGADSGHFIVLQDYIPLRVGRRCTVIFWAKAESPRSLSVQMKASDNSVSWGWTDFQLTTEWAEYTMTSQAENAVVKLEFSCAGSEVPLWLDLVSVYEGNYVPSDLGN